MITDVTTTITLTLLASVLLVVASSAMQRRAERRLCRVIAAAMLTVGVALGAGASIAMVVEAPLRNGRWIPPVGVDVGLLRFATTTAVVLVVLAIVPTWLGFWVRSLRDPCCFHCGYARHGDAGTTDVCTECGHAFGRRGPQLLRRRWPWLVIAAGLLLSAVIAVRLPPTLAWGWSGAVPDQVMIHSWPWLPERLISPWTDDGHPGRVLDGSLAGRLFGDEYGTISAALLPRLRRSHERTRSIERFARADLLLLAAEARHIRGRLNLDPTDGVWTIEPRRLAELVEALEADTRSRPVLSMVLRLADAPFLSAEDHANPIARLRPLAERETPAGRAVRALVNADPS